MTLAAPLYESPIYKDADKALARAFGEVRGNYGLVWIGASPGRSLLSPEDQVRQDAMVKNMCHEHLSRREYQLLAAKHTYEAANPEPLVTAINDVARYQLAWCDTTLDHAVSCVIHWTGRRDLISVITEGGWPDTAQGWAKVTGMKKSTINNRKWEINVSLDALYACAFDEVKSLLRVRGLI